MRTRLLWGGALLVGIAVTAWAGALPPRVQFRPFDLTRFLQSLMPLLVIAILIERTATVLFPRYAVLAGVGLGVLASLAGARTLEALIAPGEQPGELFRAVDVVLTAGLLAGGAAGFQQLARMLKAFAEARRARASQP